MRIIGGQFKGRTLTAPRGTTTRPTTDRVRESLFNILSSHNDIALPGARIIDLFAGSGALGFEALSRGGAFCLFVDSDASARGAIRDNVEALGLFGVTRIHRRSAATLGGKPAGLGAPFTLAFLDPPYGKDLAAPALETLLTGAWLAPGAMIVVEQRKSEPPAAAAGLETTDHRTFGDTQISFLRYSG